MTGNAKALREALTPFPSLCEWLITNAGKDALGSGIQYMVPLLRARMDKVRAALAAPPRNCDRFSGVVEAHKAFLDSLPEEKREDWTEGGETDWGRFAQWLFKTHKEGGAK